MARSADTNTILGIVLLILGILLLVGKIGLPLSTEIVAVLLIVAAVLIYTGKVGGDRRVALTLFVVALVLLLPVPFARDITRTIATILELLVGIALVAYGALLLIKK